MPGGSTSHIFISNGTIITLRGFLAFVVVIYIFLLAVWNSYKILCFSFIKSEIITNFVTVTINLYKSDSSYVVSWLHSVLFPLLTIQVLKLSFKWLLLLLLLSSSSSLLLLFLALCTGWSHTVVLAKGASHDPWKRTLRFRLLTLELTNTVLKILSVPRRLVFWGQWNTNSCVQLSSHLSKFFVTLANDVTTICITCTVLVFHILVMSI